MAKVQIYKKRYAVKGKVEMSVLIPVNNAKLRINFTNGIINADGIFPATFTTSDPVVQTAIENCTYFQKGLIKIEKSFKIGEIEDVKDDEKVSEEDVKDDEGKVPEENLNVFPDVKNMQSAREILINQFGVSLSELQDKEHVQKKAAQLEVKFPNWH